MDNINIESILREVDSISDKTSQDVAGIGRKTEKALRRVEGTLRSVDKTLREIRFS